MQQAQMMSMAEKAAPQGAAALGNITRDAMAAPPEETGEPVAEEQ